MKEKRKRKSKLAFPIVVGCNIILEGFVASFSTNRVNANIEKVFSLLENGFKVSYCSYLILCRIGLRKER